MGDGRAIARAGPAILIAIAVAVSTAVAQAQLDAATEPGEKLSDATGQNLDTFATPNAPREPEDVWEQLAGARFGATSPIRDSPTPFDVDFYNLSFRNTKAGFFAGAQCRRVDSQTPVPAVETAACERIPVIYEYTNRDNEGPILRESWRGADDGDPGGYVGAVAWLGEGRALAVGGDREFVEREPGVIANPEEDDPAGSGRAWLYQDWDGDGRGEWREITGTERMLAGMRGMGALGALPGGQLYEPQHPVDDYAYAGAYQRLYRWENGAFTAEEPAPLRVRGVAFSGRLADDGRLNKPPYGEINLREYSFPIAVTAGCCDPSGANDYPRSGSKTSPSGAWTWTGTPPPGSAAVAPRPWSNYLLAVDAYRYRNYAGTANSRAERVEAVMTVASPDGPEPAPSDPTRFPEPASVVVGPGGRPLEPDRGDPVATRYRLNAVEVGDPVIQRAPTEDRTDRVGWTWTAVGAFTDGEGVILRQRRDRTIEDCMRTQLAFVPVDGAPGCYDSQNPDRSQEWLENQVPSSLSRVRSYALNAITQTPGAGVMWAAGDHGAILRSGEGGRLVSDEPRPPAISPRGQTKLSDLSTYSSFRSPAAHAPAGELPALVERPLEHFPEPRFVPGSAPGLDREPTAIVMSRNGEDGWAFTPSGTLYRYDGAFWSRCDADGDPAAGKPPDRACTGAHPKVPNGVATRIPYENDPDPTNDDRFEILTEGSWRFGVKQGEDWRTATPRWRQGDVEAELVDPSVGGTSGPFHPNSLAFVSPTEGWATTELGKDTTSRQQFGLYRFDGRQGKWIRCPNTNSGLQPPRYTGSSTCFDPSPGRLPFFSVESYDANRLGARVVAAGDRVYMYGTRAPEDPAGNPDPRRAPMVIYRDTTQPCVEASAGGCWRADGGGHDPGYPGFPYPDVPREQQGRVRQLQVAHGPLGYTGWASGEFGGREGRLASLTGDGLEIVREPGAGGPISDYSVGGYPVKDPTGRLAVSQHAGAEHAYAIAGGVGALPVGLDAAAGWRILRNPFTRVAGTNSLQYLTGRDWGLVVPDGTGGAWFAQRHVPGPAPDAPIDPYFHHYTDTAQKPVFEDIAHPVRETITDIAGGEDGTVLVATDRNVVYRYDRIGGFERVVLPDWEPGRLTTAGTPVNAVTVGPDGTGLAVGEGGRIATLSPAGVRLDRAAGTVCGAVAVAPCGTSRDLVSAAIAPDGSAIVAGENAAMLWRPPQGDFLRIRRPEVQGTATFTDLVLPTPDRAYAITDFGHVFRGDREGQGRWRWVLENLDDENALITRTGPTSAVALRRIAVDEQGRGYATAATGELYERNGSGARAWRRVAPGFKLYTVALPRGGGEGAAFGGDAGLVVTKRAGRFQIARLPDDLKVPFELELLPGPDGGQLEAWAAAGDRLLHYASDPGEPLLQAAGRVEPLADTPSPRQGEVTFAAFGKSDCSYRAESEACPEMVSTNNVSGRIVEELLARSKGPGGPQFALFTGDAADAANTKATQGTFFNSDGAWRSSRNHRRWRELVVDYLTDRGVPVFAAVGNQDLAATERCGLHTPGGCDSTRSVMDNPGLNWAWRLANAPSPSPWGGGEIDGAASLRFEPVPDSKLTRAVNESKPKDPGAEDEQAGQGSVIESLPEDTPQGGAGPIAGNGAEAAYDEVHTRARPFGRSLTQIAAPSRAELDGVLHKTRTHYAFDVVAGARKLARVAVVDSSLRSLTAADPVQNPLQPRGQLGWLEEVLCVEGQPGTAASECTREAGQPAIVLSNSPTYSYGPGHGGAGQGNFGRTTSPQSVLDPPDTQIDGTTLEAQLMRYGVSAVVAGRIGWNGLYYATAPGVHEPCPGGHYPAAPPEPGTRSCGDAAGDVDAAAKAAQEPAGELSEALRGLGGPTLPQLDAQAGLRSVLPFVISSSAGGKLAEPGESGAAADGFWRGYAIVRVDGSGDPTRTIVEQRPILDWVSLTASEHTLRPGQRMTLRGSGREPYAGGPKRLGDHVSGPGGFRYIEIDSPAVTHRYDLVLADPERPYVPLEDANGEYVPVPPQVATVDHQTGRVRAGRGRTERTYTMAILSVGDKAASWPLVFEPRRSFAAARANTLLPPLPRAARAPAAQPPIRITEAFPPPPAAPPSAPASPISSQTLQPPEPPQLPALPATQAPPTPQAPAPPSLAPPPPPPAPPTVPSQQQPQPLALGAKLQAVAIVPSVNPPAPPPVNPAPPAGSAARKEAKQRQAAAARSEEGDGKAQASDSTGDLQESARAPEGIQMSRRAVDKPAPATRRVRERPQASFSPLAPGEQPSAWARGALYGGGFGLVAATLALGFSILRSRPRRRPPEVAAPAWARERPPTR